MDRTDPPYSADETTTLRSFLDYYRATILMQADGLDAAQLARRLEPSTMTLGGMLKHLAFVEDWWFGVNLAGAEPQAPWDAVDWDATPDWDWHSAAADDPDELRRGLRAAVERSNAILDGVESLDQLAVRLHPKRRVRRSARWIVVHMLEEYSRHAGHADLIRESIDGATDI